MGKETLESMLNLFINESLRQMVFSNPVNKDGFLKTKVRPVMIRGQLLFQAEGRKGNQVFHENLSQ